MATLTAPETETLASISTYGRGYSADVEMKLTVGERIISIRQMGPDFLILRETFDSPPCNAWIMLRVDDSVERWEVSLPDGIKAGEEEIGIAAPV